MSEGYRFRSVLSNLDEGTYFNCPTYVQQHDPKKYGAATPPYAWYKVGDFDTIVEVIYYPLPPQEPEIYGRV